MCQIQTREDALEPISFFFGWFASADQLERLPLNHGEGHLRDHDQEHDSEDHPRETQKDAGQTDEGQVAQPQDQ